MPWKWSVVTVVTMLAALSAPLAGEDLDAVRAAVLEHYAAINRGDWDAAAAHHGETITAFLSDSGLRTTWGTREEQLEVFRLWELCSKLGSSATGSAGIR